MIPKQKKQFTAIERRLDQLQPQRTAGLLTSYGPRGVSRRPLSSISQLAPRTRTTNNARWA